MRSANEIFAELMVIETRINNGEAAKARQLTAAKAAHRKLAREYYKALGA